MILKSETHHFHRLDLTRQAGFIVTVYNEDGLRLAATLPRSIAAEACAEARKIVNKVEGRDNEKISGSYCPLVALQGSSMVLICLKAGTNVAP